MSTARSGFGLLVTLAATLGLIATATAAPAGTAPLNTSGSTDVGAVGASPRAVTFSLAPSDAQGLSRLLSRADHARLSGRQYVERFGPSAAEVAAVTGWATSHGLTVVGVSANRLLVTVSGPADRLGSALGTSFHTFRAADGSTYVSSVSVAKLPARVAAATTAVVGLSDLARTHAALRRPAAAKRSALPSLSYPKAYGPQDFWSLYDAPGAQTGSGQSVSVIAEGNLAQPRQDLATFEAKFGLPKVTWNQINVGAASSDTSGNDEYDLDTQYSTGFAPGVSQVNVYDGSSLSNADILATINRWVTDNISKQASFSAGECELLASVSGFQAALDNVLAAAAAQGQTLFTSSGDTGSQCPLLIGTNGVPLGVPGVSYPASSPGAIGVGGTTVLGPGNEIGWYAGGGGSSYTETTPAYQQGAGGSFGVVRRGVPDVSLDADPMSGYRVIVAGTEQTIGGTSASAPAWQGIWARAQGAHAGALGFAGPVIYKTEPASAYHDILLGSNGLYPCTPGWDYVTGRGTADIAAFVAGA